MNNPRRVVILAAALVVAAAAAAAAHDHEHAHPVPEKLGSVHFATSCKAPAQEQFLRGLALLHSFAYAEAARTFAKAAATDPACGMAQWGIAMSHYHIIWGPAREEDFAAGRAAAQKAEKAGAPTERERDYIGAIAAFYRPAEATHPARVAVFEQAMAGVAKRYPDDHEASIFHALAILGVAYNAPPDKTYARQKQVAEILNRLLPLEPEHPGIAHYMIHSFDYPELAELALPAARAYAKIAPSAPHALHMPSHIFTRLGMWPESIQSNIASAETADAWVARTSPGATAFDALHAMDYLEYAYLQMGRDVEAGAIVERAARVSAFDSPEFSAGYALAAIPARYTLERRAWKDAAAIAVKPASYPWAQYPYAEAIVHFARAVGSARAGDLDAARDAITRLASIQGALAGRKGFDWATQVEVQRRAAAAWLARAEKKDTEAVTLLRSAADLEDGTDKHPVTPGSVLPAREMLADLLAELGKPKEALAEYEISLRFAPARFNSIDGAARAAAAANQPETAKRYRDQLATLCGGSIPARAASARTAAPVPAASATAAGSSSAVDPHSPSAGCVCATAKRDNAFCDVHHRGYVAAVEIHSRLLWDTLDAHGHTLDLSTFTCESCRKAIATDGFCEDHRVGFLGGLAYFSRLTYELARGEKREPSGVACPVCRKNADSLGWCDTHGLGMIGAVAIKDRQAYDRAAKSVEILRAASKEAERCEHCAMAMVTDTQCPMHRITYKDGRPLSPPAGQS
jgi:tetratricopeptide (TPR) repeat protein